MVVMKSSELPKDAVVMKEEDAVIYVWEIVNKWNSLTDTWALRYGPAVLGSLNAFSGYLMNNHFRNKLKLGTLGYFSAVIPITAMPGILTALFHRHFVSTQVLLMNNQSCPLCYEMRSAVIQSSLGMAYPLSLAPLSALMLASRYDTYRVPSLGEPQKLFQLVKKIMKPLSPTLFALSIAQFFTSSVITYFEIRNNFAIRKKIVEVENQIDEEKGYLQN